MRFYAVAEDWRNNEGENAEMVLDNIIYHASGDAKRFLEREARNADHMASLGGAAFTPIMDDMIEQAEDEIFSTWAQRPTSGHSLRIAWNYDDLP